MGGVLPCAGPRACALGNDLLIRCAFAPRRSLGRTSAMFGTLQVTSSSRPPASKRSSVTEAAQQQFGRPKRKGTASSDIGLYGMECLRQPLCFDWWGTGSALKNNTQQESHAQQWQAWRGLSPAIGQASASVLGLGPTYLAERLSSSSTSPRGHLEGALHPSLRLYCTDR